VREPRGTADDRGVRPGLAALAQGPPPLRLAAHLISYLSGEETAIPGTQPTLTIRYAARSDIGRHRDRNQDTAYAGRRLLAVADGMGDGGAQASAAVIEALKPLEGELPAGNVLNGPSTEAARPSPMSRCTTRRRATATCCARTA
jgi:hypothetical protein